MSDLRATILIVEDGDEIRLSLGEMLTDEGFITVLARDGRVALERLVEGLRPDLILLDMMMPRMDGPQFRQEQLLNPLVSAIPVVVMTALRTFDQRVMQARATLHKPFTIDQLMAAIRLALAPVAVPAS